MYKSLKCLKVRITLYIATICLALMTVSIIAIADQVKTLNDNTAQYQAGIRKGFSFGLDYIIGRYGRDQAHGFIVYIEKKGVIK